ncbi:MAG: GNAT family N-acetyltransferase [Rhizobacter sp.]|nr:GNAT family N-acetyltransferase [Rhizobacter sp.]
MDPPLIDVPDRIATERLVPRMPHRCDGAAVNAAVRASQAELAPWMPWAATLPSIDESEAHCRRAQAKFLLREDLTMFAFARADDGDAQGELVGSMGLHRIDWTLCRFEIGYWRRAACGGREVMTEAVRAIARMAFDALAARRVDIRMDDRNTASWRLAERAGITLQALLRFDSLTPAGEPRSTRVCARVRGAQEPMG